MSSKPHYSVIIPSYKMGLYICEALESVSSQISKNWEVIVVDDAGPDDGTESIVNSFAKRNSDHRVVFIRHEVNTGVSGARNTAINAAQGDYLAFLDPDDVWMPAYLERLNTFLQKNPECDLITSPPVAFWNDSGKNKLKYSVVRFKDWQISQFPHSLALGNFIQPCSTIARKSLVENIGNFDTKPDIQHIEDYDLWIRLVQAGAKFAFINENLTKYRKHPSGATSNHTQMKTLHARLCQKHTSFFLSGQSHMLGMLMMNIESFKTPLLAKIRNRLWRYIHK